MLFLRYIKPHSDKLYTQSEIQDTTGLEKRWFAIVFSAKLYSSLVPGRIYSQSVRATDLKQVYSKKDGSGIFVKSKHEEFHRLLGCDIFGTLRIHISIPNVKSKEPTPLEIMGNNVLVNVTDKNLSALFSQESLNILKYKRLTDI